MTERRLIFIVLAALFLIIGLAVFSPSRQGDEPRLWLQSFDSIEYDHKTGKVKLEKQPGLFEDQFYVTCFIDGNTVRRPASPSVKGIFAEADAPVVKGEYMLTADEAKIKFANEKCLRFNKGTTQKSLCAANSENSQTTVRMPDDPNRIYIVTGQLFSRIDNDPQLYIEKRLIVMPAGTVATNIVIEYENKKLQFDRISKPGTDDDSVPKPAVWQITKDNQTAKLQQTDIDQILAAIYGLQRDTAFSKAKAPEAKPDYIISIHVDVESPAFTGTLQRTFGDRDLILKLYNHDKATALAITGTNAKPIIDTVPIDRINQVTAQLQKTVEKAFKTP